MNTEAIRTELREGESASLDRRRKIALLSAIGAIDFSIISLYQMGVIKKLPDLPGEIFDSNKVNVSKKAYMMGVPDGTVGLSLYALTMILASAGGSGNTGRPRWLTFLLGGVVLASAGGAIDYLYDMIFKQKKVCMYCLTGAAINFSSLALFVPELKEALNYWPQKQDGDTGVKDIVKDATKEVRVIQGEETKDKLYTSHQTYENEQLALQAFKQSKEKLFNIEAWSELPGLSSTFELFDASGHRKQAQSLQKGDYIRIDLPGPVPENWVQVRNVRTGENMAEFTVNPSIDPQEKGKDEKQQIEHFFIKEASSTFRVERQGTRIAASEIGKNEGINNQGKEAGNRSMLNTLIAEGGWAFFQKVQWQKLTDYLVHISY